MLEKFLPLLFNSSSFPGVTSFFNTFPISVCDVEIVFKYSSNPAKSTFKYTILLFFNSTPIFFIELLKSSIFSLIFVISEFSDLFCKL